MKKLAILDLVGRAEFVPVDDSLEEWPPQSWRTEFADRMFLLEEEWRTYLRRPPVRYTELPATDWCENCGDAGTDQNPLQRSHRIPFVAGVRYLALTPTFLDGSINLVWAHRKRCNKELELGFGASLDRLKTLGVTRLPTFLPKEVQRAWKAP
jgi:hypothetical protein